MRAHTHTHTHTHTGSPQIKRLGGEPQDTLFTNLKQHYKCLLPIRELEAPAQKCTGTVFSQRSGPISPELCLEEESEKAGLKLNIRKTKIMASGPITSWEMDGETVKTVSDFIFWGSKITADGDC